MLRVEVRGAMDDVSTLLQSAPGPQQGYAFGASPGADAVLRLVAREGPAPFGMAMDGSIVVCTWQSAGFSRYAGISRGEYLLLLSLLGLTQWHTLQRNPDLIREDLVANVSCGCLFEQRPLLEDFAVLMDAPHICNGCRTFYEQLCDTEAWSALTATVHQLTRYRPMPLGCLRGEENALAG